jgi:hypothetical protein
MAVQSILRVTIFVILLTIISSEETQLRNHIDSTHRREQVGHPKFVDTPDGALPNEYIIQFQDTATRLTIETVINASGTPGVNYISYLYENAFKGAAVVNVTSTQIVRILDDVNVRQATYVSSHSSILV